ncbi:hypothetical protein [Myxococcus sp. AB036A]|uniref:hypothetical protein n=1 Tax=Myxococcus sp. AB036A TaxID=2562793 RepID=UPI0011464F25|nr:hypothetical protein [Myxococcus sp. AB036A]
MRYYLDTEFNGFGGELMSLALVPSDPALESFYVAVEWVGPTDPWVETHVVPYLGSAIVSRELPQAGAEEVRAGLEAAARKERSQRPSSAPPLQPSPSTGPLSRLYVRNPPQA